MGRRTPGKVSGDRVRDARCCMSSESHAYAVTLSAQRVFCGLYRPGKCFRFSLSSPDKSPRSGSKRLLASAASGADDDLEGPREASHAQLGLLVGHIQGRTQPNRAIATPENDEPLVPALVDHRIALVAVG